MCLLRLSSVALREWGNEGGNSAKRPSHYQKQYAKSTDTRRFFTRNRSANYRVWF